MKLTLEELVELQKQKMQAEANENHRVSVAVDLMICPNCGGKLKQSFFQLLIDSCSCRKCKSRFTKINTDVNYF